LLFYSNVFGQAGEAAKNSLFGSIPAS